MAGAQRRQLTYALLDQVVSSGSNVLFLLIVARVSDVSAFGVFSIVYSFFVLVVGFSRAFVTDPLLIASADEVPDPRSHHPGILTAAALLGVIGAVLVAAVAPLFESPGIALALGAALPALAVQDAYRALSFNERNAGRALLQDSCWVVVQLLITLALVWHGSLSPIEATAAWGVGGLVSAIASGVATRDHPGRGCLTWLRSRRHRSVSMAVEFVSGQGAFQLALLAVGGVLGPAGVGALRIAMLALSPLNIVAQGLYSWAMPRLAAKGDEDRVRFGMTLATALASMAIVATVVMVTAPRDLLMVAFGEPWAAVTPALLILVGIDRALAIAGLPLGWTARAHGRTKALAWARISSGIVMVAAATLLSLTFGVGGAASGLALASTLAFILCLRLARSPRTHPPA